MALVPLPEMRSKIEDRPEGLCFIMPAWRQVFGLLFLPVWLVGWLFGEVFAIRLIVTGRGLGLFLVIWLAGWTVGGVFAIFTWFWMLAGREMVLLKAASLLLRRELFGIGIGRDYELTQVRNLRVSPEASPLWSRGAYTQYSGLGGGVVAFDYGARTVRFGSSIDEAEGRMIVDRLKERYGFANVPGS